jgi:Domain of unknown function (DUF4349)
MRKGLGAFVAFTAAVFLMSGCSGHAGDDSGAAGGGDSGGESAAEGASPDELAAAEGQDEDSGSADAQPVVLLDPSTREIIYVVDLTVEVDDVGAAVRRASEMAAASGGFVASETIEGGENASITLRVPTETHSDIVTRLESLGEVRNRVRTAEDVTEEVVDVEARIASQRRSIERIRALLDQAADIDDVVRIESELATREAELDSLLLRQEELAKLTTLATVTVTFIASGSTDDDVGFVSGLRAGWNALVDAAKVTMANPRRAAAVRDRCGRSWRSGLVGPSPEAADGSRCARSSIPGVNRLDHASQHVGVGRGQDAVPKIEHVASRGATLGHDPANLAFHDRPPRAEHRGVEVSLQGLAGYPSGRLVERHPPVDPDDVRAGSTHQREQLTGADAEVDSRHVEVTDGVEDGCAVRHGEALVVRSRQHPGPGVEQLHYCRPRGNLHAQEFRRDGGEPRQQLVPQVWVGMHECLRPLVGT